MTETEAPTAPVAETTDLIKFVADSELEPTMAKSLLDNFSPFFAQAQAWKAKAEALVVTDSSQIAEMKMAREGRLGLKRIRIDANKRRRELKDAGLKYNKAVQGVYNVFETVINPIEEHLKTQEEFAKREQDKIRAELRVVREDLLRPYMEFVPTGLTVEAMTEEDFAKVLDGAKLQKDAQQKAEAAKKAEAEEKKRLKLLAEKVEAERREKEMTDAKAKAAEEEAKAIEAIKFRKEAQKKAKLAEQAKKVAEKKAALATEEALQERYKADAKIKAEQESKQRIQDQLDKAKKETEEAQARAKKAESKVETKPLRAVKKMDVTDKMALIDLAHCLEVYPLPDVESGKPRAIVTNTRIMLKKLSDYIVKNAQDL